LNTNFLGALPVVPSQSRWKNGHFGHSKTDGFWFWGPMTSRHLCKKMAPFLNLRVSVEAHPFEWNFGTPKISIHLYKCLVFSSFQQKRQLSPGCLFGSNPKPASISWWITTVSLGSWEPRTHSPSSPLCVLLPRWELLRNYHAVPISPRHEVQRFFHNQTLLL